jgi:hypothetical protein
VLRETFNRLAISRVDVKHRKHQGPAFEQAQGYAYLGDKEKALSFLEQAVERRDFGATAMKVTPYFDPLHGDPRFIALERRVGLDP